MTQRKTAEQLDIPYKTLRGWIYRMNKEARKIFYPSHVQHHGQGNVFKNEYSQQYCFNNFSSPNLSQVRSSQDNVFQKNYSQQFSFNNVSSQYLSKVRNESVNPSDFVSVHLSQNKPVQWNCDGRSSTMSQRHYAPTAGFASQHINWAKEYRNFQNGIFYNSNTNNLTPYMMIKTELQEARNYAGVSTGHVIHVPTQFRANTHPFKITHPPARSYIVNYPYNNMLDSIKKSQNS